MRNVFSWQLVLACGLALTLRAPALAAELDSFALHSGDDNAVKVILYTQGGRVDYRTEVSDQGLSVVLKNAQLSPQALRNGLPIVRDNRNRLIGQATPLQGGDVRIRIPNLAARQYAVSVIQRPAAEAPQTSAQTLSTTPIPSAGSAGMSLQPQVVTDPAFKNQFETVTAGFAPAPVRYFSFGPSPAGAGQPYGASQTSISPRQYFPEWRPERSRLNAGLPRRSGSARGASTPLPSKAPALIPESFGALALAPPSRANAASPVASTLTSPPSVATDGVPALETVRVIPPAPAPDPTSAPTSLNQTSSPSGAAQPTTSRKSTSTGAVMGALGLDSAPWWMIVLAALFFGGIGIFALTAGLLLFRFLVRPASPRVILQTAPPLDEGALRRQKTPASRQVSGQTRRGKAVSPVVVENPTSGSLQEPVAPAIWDETVAQASVAPDLRVMAQDIVGGASQMATPSAQKAADYWLPAAGSMQEAVRQSIRVKSADGRRRRTKSASASPATAAS